MIQIQIQSLKLRIVSGSLMKETGNWLMSVTFPFEEGDGSLMKSFNLLLPAASKFQFEGRRRFYRFNDTFE